jgi:hypothetical protein
MYIKVSADQYCRTNQSMSDTWNTVLSKRAAEIHAIDDELSGLNIESLRNLPLLVVNPALYREREAVIAGKQMVLTAERKKRKAQFDELMKEWRKASSKTGGRTAGSRRLFPVVPASSGYHTLARPPTDPAVGLSRGRVPLRNGGAAKRPQRHFIENSRAGGVFRKIGENCTDWSDVCYQTGVYCGVNPNAPPAKICMARAVGAPCGIRHGAMCPSGFSCSSKWSGVCQKST